MKKFAIFIPLILMMFFLIPSVLAVTLSTLWMDNTTVKTINQGDTATFYVFAYGLHPPIDISVNFTDNNYNFLYEFDNIIHYNENYFYHEYTATPGIYLNPGTYHVKVRVSDFRSWEQRELTLIVNEATQPNRPPVLNPIGNKIIDEGQLLLFLITASDPDSQDLNMQIENLPTGATVTEINPNEWQFSWRPNFNQAGIYPVFFIVSDGEGGIDSERINITVNNVNRAPILEHISDINITEGEIAIIRAYASDPDNDTLTFSINNPRFQQSNNVFTWQTHEGDEGVYTVRVYVSDGSLQDYQDITVTVNNLPYENHAPIAIANATPQQGYAPLIVHFRGDQSYDPDRDTITYYWDFGDGENSTETNPIHIYQNTGVYTAFLTVSDGNLYDISEPLVIYVNEPMHRLNVSSIVCFPSIIVRHNQSCSVYVSDIQTGQPVGGAQVIIYFYDPDEFGRCITDRITGGCEAQRQMNRTGNFTVYAEAHKEGYIPDNDTWPRYRFQVIPQAYRIVDLTIYNDSNFQHEDYDFFRGENLYAKFRVVDLGNNTVPNEIVSMAALVSHPGGRVNLTRMSFENGYYYYKLEPIPPSHDFLGDSFVFAFVFNNGQGGEAQVGVSIRNNPPDIIGMPIEVTMYENETLTFELQNYEYDVEDSGSNLTWIADIPYNNYFTGDVVGKTLHLIATSPGEAYITLILTDLDGATDASRVLVKVLPIEHPNTPPNVIILSPNDNSQFKENEIIIFTGRGFDVEDGPLPNSSLEWSSSINGILGYGRTIQHNLSVGTHIITLTGTDSQGLRSNDTIRVIVLESPPDNYPPTAVITSPKNNARVLSPIKLTGYGTDTDGQSIRRLRPEELSWYYIDLNKVHRKVASISDDTSQISGVIIQSKENPIKDIVSINSDLGGGKYTDSIMNIRKSLSYERIFIGKGDEQIIDLEPGTYQIILKATDEDGMTDEDSIIIYVVKTQEVDVKIISPADGTLFENRAIQFTGTGSYFDGIDYIPLRDDQLHWKSSIDGDIGTGRKITQLLSRGRHTITLTGIHESGLQDIDVITITVGEKVEEDEARLYIGDIDLIGVEAGEKFRAKTTDTVRLNVFIENTGDFDLDDLELYLIIPELGIKTQSVRFNIEKGEDDNVELDFDLYNEPVGLYNAKIVIQNRDIKRVKYRDLRIIN
ncbi:MAG: PKD domain-containing protein [Candidatus Woesearchaeota archaeon]